MQTAPFPIVIRAAAANLRHRESEKNAKDLLISSDLPFDFFTRRKGGKAAYDWSLLVHDLAVLAKMAQLLYNTNRLLVEQEDPNDKRVGLVVEILGFADLWVNGLSLEDIAAFLVEASLALNVSKNDTRSEAVELQESGDWEKQDR